MTLPQYPANIYRQDGELSLEGFTEFTAAGSQPAVIRGPFPFTHSTAGLTSGVTLYTPAIGDVIYDIGVSVVAAFNGTTPKADVGTFSGGNSGLFDELAGAVIDLTAIDAAATDNAGLSLVGGPNWLQAAVGSAGAGAGATYVPTPIIVTAANPLLLVVNQTGAKGGSAVGGTTGAGAVYVLTQTPVPFS